VRNRKVLDRVKGARNDVQTVKRRKADWMRHILRRSYLLQSVIESKIKEKTRKKTHTAIG
jgi:hypothetical protein